MEPTKILKYIKGIASQKEMEEVQRWMNASHENEKTFNLLKARYITSTFQETAGLANTNKSYNAYRTNIEKRSRNTQKSIRLKTLKYAAVLTVLLSTAYLFKSEFFNKTSDNIPEGAIVLELENGDTRVIVEGNSAQLVDSEGNTIGEQNGNKLEYNGNDLKLEKLTYNTLTVPYGKRFDIILSDNTRVTLNAGTSLRYPVKFIKGHKREVFITGEAFFDVTKDEAHPFIVNTKGLNISVLGTKFNVSSYPEDFSTKTVLVEGAVGLYQEADHKKNDVIVLEPGQLGAFNKSTNTIAVDTVDTSLYTAWIDGTISFKHEPFKNILKKLERHYNVSIHCESKALNETSFTASFNEVSLEYILETFENNYDIKYTMDSLQHGKTIKIKL